MGLFGGLFGGGGTSVSTTTTQKSTINVSVDPQIGIQNTVDLEPVQKLVDHFAASQGDVGKGLEALGAAQTKTADAIKSAWDDLKIGAFLVGAGLVAWKAYGK